MTISSNTDLEILKDDVLYTYLDLVTRYIFAVIDDTDLTLCTKK